jgi:hypothetical protein
MAARWHLFPTASRFREEFAAPRPLVFVAYLAIAFALGAALSHAIHTLIPTRPNAPPLALIAASFVLVMASQALTAGFLGTDELRPWHALLAGLKSALIAGAGTAGIFVSGAGSEPFFTALLIALLCVALAAAWCAAFSVLAALLGTPRRALQALLLLAAIANTGLFWSREVITSAATRESKLGNALPNAVMYGSPPLALASVWHQESAAARREQSDQSRFDLIRAPLTYDVWIGSYQAVPYAAITPAFPRDGQRTLGLLGLIFFFALPTLWISEALRAREAGARQK